MKPRQRTVYASRARKIGPSWLGERFRQGHKFDSAIAAFRALYAFLSRRYWKRRWIVQELFHAKVTYWHWGPCWMRFEGHILPSRLSALMVDMIEDFQRTTRFRSHERWWNLPNPRELYNLSESVQCITATRSAAYLDRGDPIKPLPQFSETKLNMSDALAFFNGLRCSEPKDVIFAIASVCKPTIFPNYELSVAEVYTQAARALINDGQAEWIFRDFAKGLMSSPEWWQEHSHAPQNLPFWVPDIRKNFSSGAYKGFESGNMVPMRVCENNVLYCEPICWGVVKRVQDDRKHRESRNGGIAARITIESCQHGLPVKRLDDAEKEGWHKPKAKLSLL